ncbi:MAG TPA: sulfotransferase [Pseudolabrys sp.]|nr:sulfotransferase [Pseudolabrys sp.]
MGRRDIASTFRAAVQYSRRGALDEAARLFQQILAVSRDHFESLCNLGLIRVQQQRFDEAVRLLRKAAYRQPNSVSAQGNLGNALAGCGRYEEALAHFRKTLALAPGLAEAHHNVATTLRILNRFAEAEPYFERTIELKPDYPDARKNYGAMLLYLNRSEEALAQLERAATLRPDAPDIQSLLGAALIACSRLDDAIAHCRKAVSLDPRSAEAHRNLGKAMLLSGAVEEGIVHLEKAVELRPDDAEARQNLIATYASLGRFTAMEPHVLKGLALDPGNTVFYLSLVDIKTLTPDDPHLAAMERLVADSSRLSDGNREYLHFALAKAHADMGNHGRSFDELLRGNALRRRRTAYDEAETVRSFQRIREVFTIDFMRHVRDAGASSDVPIFVVGMPRSGSTLIEQILASHPETHGGGELLAFETALLRLDPQRGFPEIVASAADAWLRALGEAYLSTVRPLAPTARRITDKNLLNFSYVGLIHLALPRAHIIHVRRDPLDTCLSCFAQPFSGNLPFTCDLAELGRYYRAYEAMMAHWRAVLPPGAMLEIDYEDVVADYEHEARRIVAYCGLDWNDACLEFHKTPRAVHTASFAQVRRPIYKGSVGRAEAYRERLAPLIAALEGTG